MNRSFMLSILILPYLFGSIVVNPLPANESHLDIPNGSQTALETSGVIEMLRGPVGPAAPKQEKPGVEHIGMVAPDIMGITLQSGSIEYGLQIPYVKQETDRIDRSHFPHRLVGRNGKYLGALAGQDEKIIYTPDRFIPDSFDPAWADRSSTYHIRSEDDPEYSQSRQPLEVYRKSKPSDFARVFPGEIATPMEHTIYLKLPKALSIGKRYTIEFTGDVVDKKSFIFNPAMLRSEAVHISHLGFRPDDPVKIAFLSSWLGSGGPLEYGEKQEFYVVEAESGHIVYEGPVKLSKELSENDEDAFNLNYSGTDVYEMFFSSLRKEGTYRVVVQGIGCSYPFKIGRDVWGDAFTVAARGFYHQRSGIALGPPYTTYQRPRSFHPDDGVRVYASEVPLMDTYNSDFRPEKPMFAEIVRHKTDQLVPEAWGGYMDAGDWDRRIQHLTASRRLLELAELFPDYFSGLSLNIPESNDGLPDIVSEALFNLDCYRRMQTPSGGIRGGIESSEHPRLGEASWQESLDVMAYAPGVWSSFIYAGVAAQAAGFLKKIGSDRENEYRLSAVRAMLWAERELPKRNDKNDPHDINDARNLAAAELFRLTGDREWHDLFLATTFLKASDAPLYIWDSHDQRDAAWVYIRTEHLEVDPRIQKNCRNALIQLADERLQTVNRTGFHWTKDPWYPPGYGTFSHPDAISLTRAHVLTNDEMYLRGIVLASQTGAGANPLNMSYTTGVGHKWPRHPLHVDSKITNQPPPFGITVLGPMAHMLAKNQDEQKHINEALFPKFAKWPVLESYFDVTWYSMMCEFTVHNPMSSNAYVWGYLAARE